MFESRGWYCFLYLKTEAMMWGTRVTFIPFLNTPNQKEQNAVFRVVPALTPEYSSQVTPFQSHFPVEQLSELYKMSKFLSRQSNQVLISPLNIATEIGRFCTFVYYQYKATFFTWVSQDRIFSTISNHSNNDTGEGAGLVLERI